MKTRHIAFAPKDCWIVAGTPGALVDVVSWDEKHDAWRDQHGRYPMPQPTLWLCDVPSICPPYLQKVHEQ